jgi:hypothetical protein
MDGPDLGVGIVGQPRAAQAQKTSCEKLAAGSDARPNTRQGWCPRRPPSALQYGPCDLRPRNRRRRMSTRCGRAALQAIRQATVACGPAPTGTPCADFDSENPKPAGSGNFWNQLDNSRRGIRKIRRERRGAAFAAISDVRLRRRCGDLLGASPDSRARSPKGTEGLRTD